MQMSNVREPQLDHDEARGSGGPPSWARWNRGFGRRYTVGAEEELILLAPDLSLAQSSDGVLPRLSRDLRARTFPETHASVIELATEVHPDAAGAAAELAALRARLSRELSALGLRAACAGTYPLAGAGRIEVSGTARYGHVAESMRMLARRQPTMALHVHVGVPDPEDAIRLLNGLRDIVPVLLALSANSPFCEGRDTGFASARTVIFGAFPRTGTARRFASYGDYVSSVQPLIASGALPDPSFLWWDLRLQPRLGTVEVRVMDAQSTVADSLPLIALIQSFARLVLESGPPHSRLSQEVLGENRFLAARDGVDARLIDPVKQQLMPVRTLAEALVNRCQPYAAALGCTRELDQIERLTATNGADRQRVQAANSGLLGVVSTLTDCFAENANDREEPAGPRLSD